LNGEVYYRRDKVTRADIAQRRGVKAMENAPQKNLLGVTSIVPALEIIDVFTGKSLDIVERYSIF